MPSFDDNIILITDSYKVTHHKQYPPGTTKVYSYFESRGGKFGDSVFFGLQYILKRYLVGPVVTREKIEQAAAYFKAHFGNEDMFNRAGWEYILQAHGGRLPIEIKAVPEGSIVPVKNVLLTVENTDDQCFWLVNYLETLLVQVWYPMTVATNSREQKKIIAAYLQKTGCPLAGLGFKLHDFGFRGVSSVESAGIGGAAHLVNFMGTDTMAGFVVCDEFYGEKMAGFSIPAAEHSTMTTFGRDGEERAYRNMLEQFPTGLVAVVSDSYDVHNACENIWGGSLKEMVEKRDGTLVVRPDSGDPPVIVCELLEILGKQFGTKTTSTGHKMLPDCLRVIQGDGIDYETIGKILGAMEAKGWAADNLAFGSGGALLQKLNRDTMKCAFKCSFAVVEGKDVNVFKDPKTDPGKKSKKGRLTLAKEGDTYVTVEEGKGTTDELVTVFKDGKLTAEFTLKEIRARAKLPEE
jgi:nicotinamide phosphoribosyltransferase